MMDEAVLADLARRVGELERAFHAGDADRPLDFLEACARATTRSPATVRSWWKRKPTRKRLKLELLFQRDATGRLTSTPRRVRQWQDAVRAGAGAS